MQITLLNEHDKQALMLVARTNDRGEGWRWVSPQLWKAMVEKITAKELFEIDSEKHRVRLTPDAVAVVRYAVGDGVYRGKKKAS